MKCSANTSHMIAAGNGDNSVAAKAAYTYDLGVLLSALSTMLRDTLGRFEAISSQVTERVLTRGDAADHDLIVALQDFDRLQQEFAALGDVISHCATVSSAVDSASCGTSFGHAAIAEITLSDLKVRFLQHLQASTTESTATADGDEQVF